MWLLGIFIITVVLVYGFGKKLFNVDNDIDDIVNEDMNNDSIL